MKRAAEPDSRYRVPFGPWVQLPYQTRLDGKQFQQVQLGLNSVVMEDKWFVYYEKPYLYFHRSWTGQPVYRLRFEERDGSATVVEALWSAEVANQQGGNIEYEAQRLDFLLYAVVLHEMREFPLPADWESLPQGLLQHHYSGTAFPETIPKSKKDKTGE